MPRFSALWLPFLRAFWSHVDEQHVHQAAFSHWLVSLSPMERTTKTTMEGSPGGPNGGYGSFSRQGRFWSGFWLIAVVVWRVFGCFDTSADRILESVWHATFNIKPHLWSVWIDVELTHRQRYRSCWPYVGSPKSGDFDFSIWGVEIRTEQYDGLFFQFFTNGICMYLWGPAGDDVLWY